MQLRQQIDVTGLSLEQRKEAAGDTFIYYERINKIIGLIDKCRHSGDYGGEPKSMYIAGQPGAGKTGLMNEVIEHSEIGERSDFLKVTVVAHSTVKNVAEDLLSGLGDPFSDRASNSTLQHRVAKMIHARNIKLIFIDECQHLTSPGTKHGTNMASDWLKSLITLAEVPVVALGQKEGDEFLKNPQLNRRFGYRESIEPFALDVELATVIRSLDDALPTAEESTALYGEWIELIWKATGGIMFFLTRLIREAAFHAIEEKRESVARKDLAGAFEDELRHMRSEMKNPFR